MTKCYQSSLPFPPVKRRKVEANFTGGDITSNAGIGLIAKVDRQMGLTKAVAHAMGDPRRKASCDHSLLELLQQRTYGLALGYEDLNDHDELSLASNLRFIIPLCVDASLLGCLC